MAIIGKLKALNIAREKRPGSYGDGGGLYLQVTGAGTKSWIFRYWIAERDSVTGEVVFDPATNKTKGRSREMGLGSYITVSLAEARDRALECRKLREKGIDPIGARDHARRQAAVERVKSLKFKDAASRPLRAMKRLMHRNMIGESCKQKDPPLAAVSPKSDKLFLIRRLRVQRRTFASCASQTDPTRRDQ
jgi:hypothetical protein